MKFSNGFRIGVWVGILTLGTIGVVAKQATSPAPAQKGAATSDPAQTATKTPSAQWLMDYDSYMALNRVIVNLKQQNGIDKLEAELNRQGNALAVQIPAGYTFDPVKKVFILPPSSPAPLPPAPK